MMLDIRSLTIGKKVVEAHFGLISAPLDTFETLPGWRANDALRAALFTTSLAHRTPVLLLHDDVDNLRPHLTMPGLNEALEGGFEAFCNYAAPRWRQLRETADSLCQYIMAAQPANSHPLIRLMRDHWFWIWFELFSVAKTIADQRGSQTEVQIIFWRNSKIIIAGILPTHTTRFGRPLIGPTIFNTITDNEFEEQITNAMVNFCKIIDDAWASLKDTDLPETMQIRSGGRFPLYTASTLSRVAGSKLRTNPYINTFSICRQIESVADQVSSNCLLGPYRTIFRIAAVAAAFDLNEDSFGSSGLFADIDSMAEDKSGSLTPKTIRYFVHINDVPSGVSNKQGYVSHAIIQQEELITSAWRAYLHDAQSILNEWLTRGLWERVALGGADEHWGDLGRRLTRFLAATFLANECSIYKVNYTGHAPELISVGGYSDDIDGGKKVELVSKYMANISNLSDQRSRSICYRAMYNNQTQYVDFEPASLPEQSQRLAFPPNTNWTMRGRSAVAIPIRVNGAVWGIAELISFNYDQFPTNVRSRLSEIVESIGAAISFQNVSALLNNIDKITASNDISIIEKKEKIIGLLPNYFLCTDIAILATKGQRIDELEINVLASNGSDPKFQIGGDLAGHLFTDAQTLLKTNAPVMIGNLMGSEQRLVTHQLEISTGNLIFVALPKESINNHFSNIMVARFPVPIFPHAAWHLPFRVLGQYANNAIETVEAEVNWIRFQRAQFGHEMLRHTATLSDVAGRIRRELSPPPASANDRSPNSIGLALSDLERARQALKIYAEALTDATLPKNGTEDPRIAAIVRHFRNTRNKKRQSLDIRDVFNSAAHSRRTEARSANIVFPPLPSFRYPRLVVDDVIIYEVLSTLVDNAIKYSARNTPVIGNIRYDGDFAFAISNLGPEILESEERHIFADRVRGQYAMQALPKAGRGLGLGYARRLMELLDGDLTHRQRPAETKLKIEGFNLRWHHFTLIFPREAVENG